MDEKTIQKKLTDALTIARQYAKLNDSEVVRAEYIVDALEDVFNLPEGTLHEALS